jgi:hypothetical protein
VDVAIVGSGLSGLMAATVLSRSTSGITLLDKGRSVGGRLATRRIGAGRADHGAQFFTVRSEEFGRWVTKWESEDVVFRWSTGWNNGSLDETPGDGHPRYAVRSGMNALAQRLASDLTTAGVKVENGVTVTAVAEDHGGWRLDTSAGPYLYAASLILTPPVPQVLALFQAGDVDIAREESDALARITYAPCLCGLFRVDGEVRLPEPGARQTPEADVTWIADNMRKGISPQARIITIHAGQAYSSAHYTSPDANIIADMEGQLVPLLAADARILEAQLKRWRYALPTTLHPERYLRLAEAPPCYIGGDAFGGPRIEGAALSGMAIAAELIPSLH